MVYAFRVFEEIGTHNIPRRDDLMLLNIARRLPDLIALPIANPVEPAEQLGANWSYEERRAAIKQVNEMLEHLDMAIYHCYLPDVAVERMRAVFGDRIPRPSVF